MYPLVDGCYLNTGLFSIQALMSSTRHAVTLSDSFTGDGNEPVLTFRQSVADENGTMVGINCDWRMYPSVGNTPSDSEFIWDMLWNLVKLFVTAWIRYLKLRQTPVIADMTYEISEDF